jgi:hypothetical protein
MCLNFFSTAKEEWRNGRVIVRRTIRKARYWNPGKVNRTKQFKASLANFEEHLQNAKLLKDFIHPEKEAPMPEGIVLQTLISAKIASQRQTQEP